MKFTVITQALCFSLCAAASSLACAATASGPWYLSASGSVFQGQFNTQYNDQTDAIQQNLRQSVQQNGYLGSIAAGYLHTCHNNYLLGGELSISGTTSTALYSAGAASNAINDKTSIPYFADLALLAGFVLSDSTYLYAKIGFSYAAIDSNLNSPTGFIPSYIQANATRYAPGGVFGLGLKKMINSHVAVYGEYNYHDYATVDFANFQNFTATYSHTVHASANSVGVGVTYFI